VRPSLAVRLLTSQTNDDTDGFVKVLTEKETDKMCVSLTSSS